jgi:hypothetical protein
MPGFFDDFLKGWDSGNDRPASSTNPLGKNPHWDPAAMAVLGTAAGGTAIGAFGRAGAAAARAGTAAAPADGALIEMGLMPPAPPSLLGMFDTAAVGGIAGGGAGYLGNELYRHMTSSGSSASPAAAPAATPPPSALKPVASIWANGAQVDANHPAVAEAERLGAVIGRENPGRALIPNEYWYRIGGNADGQYDPQQFARPFKPTNQQEFDRMPPGTEYHDRQNKLQKKPGAPAPVAQDMVNRKPGAPAKYQQFREPGSGRTPALLKEMQAGGMMPKDMQLSRFMTMPSPDYLGTLNENTATKTGTPVMAKNRLPPASLEPPTPQFAPPTTAYDEMGVGSLFDQDPQMLMHKDRGHNLVRQGLDSVPGGLDPSLLQVPGPERAIPGGALSRAMTEDPGPAYMNSFHRPVPRSHEYEIPTPLIDSEPVQVQRKNWGPLTERDMHEKYYADRAGLPWQPRLPQVSSAPEPGSYTPTDPTQLSADFQAIRQQLRDSSAAEVAKREAESERLRTQGGYFSGGNGYVSLKPGSWTAEAQAEVDNFHANQQPAGTMMPNRAPLSRGPGSRPAPQSSGGSSYVPGGVEQGGAIRTGDPFFDVNIDFDRLQKEKLLKDQNDAVFAKANNARMGDIAANRHAAEDKRYATLSAQGKGDDTIERIMFPQRFAQPKDPAIEQAKAIDAAERQGRSNLHAIAQKFRRNGIPIDQAYAAAMNTIKTTNPADKGAVPSLPGMDPLRVIGSVGGSAGASASNYGVGMANAHNALTLGNQTSADNRYGIDSRERVGLAQAQNNFIQSLLENAQKEQELRMNQGVVNSETSAAAQARNLEMIKLMQGQGVHNLPPGHPDRAHYDKLWQGMMGSPANGDRPDAASAASAGDALNNWVKWMGGGPGSPPPAAAPAPAPPMNAAQHYASNPAAMKQYLETFPLARQPYEAAKIMAEAGQYSDPYISDYAKEQFKGAPNLEWGWDNEPDVLADWAAKQPGGLPREAYLPAARQYYGQ